MLSSQKTTLDFATYLAEQKAPMNRTSGNRLHLSRGFKKLAAHAFIFKQREEAEFSVRLGMPQLSKHKAHASVKYYYWYLSDFSH